MVWYSRLLNFPPFVMIHLVAQMVKSLSAMQETQVQSLGWEDPLEEETATHSSNIAWKIPWIEEPGRYSPWSRRESDTTEQLHFLSLSPKDWHSQ